MPEAPDRFRTRFPACTFVRLLLLVAAFSAVAPIPNWLTAAVETPKTPEEERATRLQQIGSTVQAQLQQGKRSKSEFAGYLRELDAFQNAEMKPASAEAGQILYLQAMILLEVFKDCDRALEAARELEKVASGDWQKSAAGLLVGQALRCAEMEQGRRALLGNAAPPIDFTWSSRSGLSSLSQLSGKVVVIDFWANTDPYSVAMFPMMRRLHERYAGLDVEVIGVSHPQGVIFGLRSQPMDFRGKPDREIRQMASYMKAKEITWPIAFGDPAQYLISYGVTSYPAMCIIAPDGTVRHIGVDADMAYLTRVEMIDRILAEFGRPTSGVIR